VDALAIYLSLLLAYDLRISSGLLDYTSPYNPAAYQRFALTCVPIWLALFGLFGLYRRDTLLGGTDEYKGVLRACTSGVMAIITVTFVQRSMTQPSRGWLLLSLVLSCLFVVGERFLMRRVGYALRRRGWLTARALIVGANDQGAAIAEQWQRSGVSGMTVVGFLDDFKPVGSAVLNGVRVLGRPSALDQIAHEMGAEEIVVVTGGIAWESFEEIIARTAIRNGYTLRLSPGFYDLLATGVVVTNKSFVPLLRVDGGRLVGLDAALKWLVDYGLGAPLLLLSLPLMIALRIWLRLTNAELPVLERCAAVGRHGTSFTMYRFRRPPMQGPDAATTRPGGSIIQRSGLDKLPQLLNVMAGQMSLVGPRPRLTTELDAAAGATQNLQSVKPGMLGPWLKTGHLGGEDEMREELHYIRNWTLWLDLQIIMYSVVRLLAVVTGRHAGEDPHMGTAQEC
jgi:lipopolysaccharide/colanic/teichoic acid biosynthesis glycosyltransferase